MDILSSNKLPMCSKNIMIIPPKNVKSSLTGVKSSLTGPNNYFYIGGSHSMVVSPYHGVLFQLPSG